MRHLYQQIASRVATWRAEDYTSDDFPAVAEVFEWA